MHHCHHHYGPPPVYQRGLMGVFGGIINLTTAVLYGGARISRSIVEGAVWGGAEPPYHHNCCCHHHTIHHTRHVHCVPENHDCCGCC